MAKTSKYEPLWDFIKETGSDCYILSFSEIEKIVGLTIDHSFLKCKKELLGYGYKVGKISLKEKTVSVLKIKGDSK